MAYSEDQMKQIKDKVCRGIAAGLSVKKCCEADEMPNKDTIFQWLMEDQDFSDQYARARERRADARAERIDDVTDEVRNGKLDPNSARVIIDAEKWQAGKENAPRYGDRIQVDGDLTVKMSDEQLEHRIAHLFGKTGAIAALRGTGSEEGAA